MTARCDLVDQVAPALPDVETIGAPFKAEFREWCARCTRRTAKGQMIAHAADGGYVHADAEDCS